MQIFANLKDGAIKNQTEISRAIQELKNLISQFQSSAAGLPRSVSDKVKGELAGAVSQAVNGAADRIIEKHTAANLRAEEAERAYARAVRWSFMRLFLVCLCFFAVGILGMVMAAKHVLPDYETIKALRQEKLQLEQTIAELERRGGKAIIITCPDGNRSRPCIRTDEQTPDSWKKNGETYRIIYGY
ncbi:MAG: hypothetical protein HQL43_06875 [Alphaproteobacteria bacterium]|nr:hypothetical protein [Alphaproteobacteria bacterium]